MTQSLRTLHTVVHHGCPETLYLLLPLLLQIELILAWYGGIWSRGHGHSRPPLPDDATSRVTYRRFVSGVSGPLGASFSLLFYCLIVLSIFPNALRFPIVQLGVFFLSTDTRPAPMTWCRLIERGIKWVSRSGVDSVNSTSGSGDRRIQLHMPRPLPPFASVQAITTWGVLPFVCQLVDSNVREASR